MKSKVLDCEVSPELKNWDLLEGVFSRFLAWLMLRMPNERQRLLVFTILAGGLCGLAAVAFHISVLRVEARNRYVPGIRGSSRRRVRSTDRKTIQLDRVLSRTGAVHGLGVRGESASGRASRKYELRSG